MRGPDLRGPACRHGRSPRAPRARRTRAPCGVRRRPGGAYPCVEQPPLVRGQRHPPLLRNVRALAQPWGDGAGTGGAGCEERVRSSAGAPSAGQTPSRRTRPRLPGAPHHGPAACHPPSCGALRATLSLAPAGAWPARCTQAGAMRPQPPGCAGLASAAPVSGRAVERLPVQASLRDACAIAIAATLLTSNNAKLSRTLRDTAQK
jgi:hypothetical protein